MLRFSKTQQEMILNARRQHALQHQIMAQQYGFAANDSKPGLIGNADPVPKDVWGEWDTESVQLQRNVLAVFNDLAASVSRPINIGKLVHFFRNVTDSSVANITLDGRAKAKTDQPLVAYHGTPLPIIDSTFSFGRRQMAAFQSEGDSLEDDGRNNSNRKVADKLEDLIINGDSSIVVGGDELFGLTNHPKRATRTTGVTLNGATGAQWVTEITATLVALHAKNFREGVTLYVNWDDWFFAGANDFSTTKGDKTIAQRVLEIAGVNNVVPASKVLANGIIGVVKRREVLQILNGMPMTTRAQFRANPEDDFNFLVMAAAALEIKYDADDNAGVVYSAPA